MRIYDTALFAESWNVAFRERPQGSILQDQSTPFTPDVLDKPETCFIKLHDEKLTEPKSEFLIHHKKRVLL